MLLLLIMLAQYQPQQPPRDPYHYEQNLRQWQAGEEWQHQRQQDRIEQELRQERDDDEGPGDSGESD